MSEPSYTLTESQQRHLRIFVVNQLSDIIDEELHSGYLFDDVMVDNDMHDEINDRKMAAIEYIKSIL